MAKFTVTFKDPDYSYAGMSKQQASWIIDKFLEWDEYLTVEFDSETGEGKVIPVSKKY